MTIGRNTVATVALLWGVLPGALVAQEIQVIEGDCVQCGLVSERVLTLGGPDLPFEFSHLASVAVDSRGRVITASILNPGSFAIFKPDGSLDRAVGRAGEGPGEYGRISAIAVGPGDSLLIADGARVSVTSASGDFVRTIRSSGRPTGMAFGPRGIYLFAPPLSAGRRPPDRVTHFSPSGQRTTLAPAPVAISEENMDQTLGAVSWSATRGGLWVASHPSYEIELHREGAIAQILRRQAPWFEPWDRVGPDVGLTEVPYPRLVSVVEDENGLVWTAITVADSEWVPVDPSLDAKDYDPQSAFDTIIEVLDPDQGRVVAHQRFDQLLTLVGGAPFAYATRTDVIGRVVVDLFSFESPKE